MKLSQAINRKAKEYLTRSGDNLIILFAGSTKSDQQKVIQRAKVYLADYKARKNEGDQYATN